MDRYLNYIGGRWAPPAGDAWNTTRNPAHPGQCVGIFPASSKADADSAIAAAAAAAAGWAATPGPQRGAVLFRFADLLEKTKQELAQIITVEQGKALSEAVGEVGRAAAEARFAAGEASRLTGCTFPSERTGYSCQTLVQPLGVVAAISPWNFPVVTPVRKIAPALACGNTVVFKPSSLTPWSAVYLTELLETAGVPAGVVNLVIGSGREAGEPLVNDERVRGISFTGSTDVGIPLYAAAARRMAKVQLELGGKNPAVVFDYDDLESAAREIVSAAFLCSGQRCTALSRVIVCESQGDELVERLLNHVRCIRVGDGLEPDTTMGPLVSKGQLQTVDRFVQSGIRSTAKLLVGGRAVAADPDVEGYYYEPTLFDNVTPDSPLALEEIFGPVLPVLRVRSFDEALAIVNGTRYGLAACLFTTRLKLIHAFVEYVQTGMIHVNHGTASQAHVPFGGIRDSGQGAYSIGHTAQDFYSNLKTVYYRWE